MRDVLDIWEELFGAAPTPSEEDVVRNLTKVVDPEDTCFIVCAVVVRYLTQALLIDPSSPVNLGGRMGKALQELEARAKRLDDHLLLFDEHLKLMKGHAFVTTEALRDARKFSEERRKIPRPVLQLDPDTGSPYWRHTLAPNALRSIGLVAGLSSMVGGLMTVIVVLAVS
jgi:hypothetical protein